MADKETKAFPKEYPQCPNCGSETTVTDIVLQDMRDKGIASEKLQGWIMSGQIKMMPDKPALSMPVILWAGDICYECGTIYAKSVAVTVGMVSTSIPTGYVPPNIGQG